MLRAEWTPYMLDFRFTAVTSRESMRRKQTYFVRVYDSDFPGVVGYGECALFKGLSHEDNDGYEAMLDNACRNIMSWQETVPESFSSIRFGLETAMLDLASGGRMRPFDGQWAAGQSEIVINGLVWMGSREQMQQRIEEKLRSGFRCVKLKIGGIDFNREVELIAGIRERFSPETLELRLDANGAFGPGDALDKLGILAGYGIHSIEQPIKPRQWEAMRRICLLSPIDIALDEELIGLNRVDEMEAMLVATNPRYIILKPALCGGFSGADRWINLASNLGIGWWATSALESNIGLNAIAQWVSHKENKMPQGLGTGALYRNNIPSPLRQERDVLLTSGEYTWDLSVLNDMKWN